MKLNIFLHWKYVSFILLLIVNFSEQVVINFTIYENIPINSRVGDLNETITLLKINNPQFQIIYCDKNSQRIDYLYVNTSDRSIYTKTEIDRELICVDQSGTLNDCFITLGLTLNQYIINVYIYILDINDNSPKFQTSETYFQILESEPVGFRIKLNQAIDLDSSKNGVFHYSLECHIKAQQGYFKLNRTISTLSLVIIKPLDYETIPKYALHLVACDRGHPQLCSSQKLIINVIDLNDEAPKFLSNNYTSVVSEDLPIGSILLKVHAVDKEAGDFGKVVYKLSNDQEYSTSYINIDSETGVIILRKSLSDIDKLVFIIEAHDSAKHNSKFDWARVTIFIININNHKPNISIGNAKKIFHYPDVENPFYVIDTFENNPENLEISFINVIDKDNDRNGDVKCTIKSEEDMSLKSLFYLDTRTRLNKYTFQYKLRSHQPIDREIITNPLNLTIFCQDNGQPILHSFVKVQINVLDQNEYPALFTKPNYSISVYEETINITILSFAVIDQDALTFNEFYLNSSNDFLIDKYFHLNSLTQSSGEIFIFNPLDREKFDQLNFFIFVINRAQDKKTFSSSVLIHVQIIDVNDNSPEYIGEMTFEVRENNIPFAEIGTVKFIDKDVGENGVISLKSVTTSCQGPKEKLNEYNNVFVISNTKSLKVTQSLDYESIHHCRILISFQDHGIPIKTNQARITVNIFDENDNNPEWIYPSNTDNIVNISQLNIKIGTRLTRVRAIDIDHISSDKLTYELREKSSFASIDSITGEIMVISDIEPGTYQLDIIVNDNGNPSRNSSANLTVNIYPETLFPSINNITRAVLTIILIPAFVIIFSSGSFIFIVLFLRRRHRSNTNFKCKRSAVIKNQNFSINTFKTVPKSPKDFENASPNLMMTSLHNSYYYKPDHELDLQNEKDNIPSNIAQLFLKRSVKPDCEVCSSVDSGQGASEEEILLYNYKSKPDKLTSQQLSNYIFQPLMEEDNNNSFYYFNSNRSKQHVDNDHNCNCYNEFVNRYAESDQSMNFLSLLHCPIHNQMTPLVNNSDNNINEYICNNLASSDPNR